MAFVYERFSLKGKVAVVTGAGQGIGKGIALGLAEVGAKVAIAEKNPETGPVTEKEIKAMGSDAITVTGDIRQLEVVNKVMKAALDHWGRIDVLVNNAGGTFFIPAIDISPNGFDSIINLNLKTMFLCSQAAAKTMIAAGRGGSIVSIASMNAILGAFNHAPYGAAKAGVIGMTRALATEWGVHGIRVNAVAPGGIDTEGTRGFSAGRERDFSHVPLQRQGQPQDIAGAVVFLATDLAAYVTGQTLLVDGGVTFRPSTSGPRTA